MLFSIVISISLFSQGYQNPVLPGFYPDPSVCRVGDDYYISAGLFADNAGFELESQIFIDCKAPYYELANDTPKLTESEFLAMVGGQE